MRAKRRSSSCQYCLNPLKPEATKAKLNIEMKGKLCKKGSFSDSEKLLRRTKAMRVVPKQTEKGLLLRIKL
jgi:hypothetical protein